MIGHEDASRVQAVVRVTWVGLWVNVTLAVAKIVAGYLGRSSAVVADGIHSLSDMATDVAILVGARFWSAPADSSHPYGHSRLEYLVTLGIALALAATGIFIAAEAVISYHERMSQPESGRQEAFTLVAAAAALISIVVKEALYRWTVRKGRQLGSPALVANAWHHRSDALSSIPAFLAAFITAFWPRLEFVDVIGAVIVAIFIVGASWEIAKPAIDVLMDHGVTPKVMNEILECVASVPGVRGVHAVRTRSLGQGIHVDMHIMVDGQMSVQCGYEVGRAVEEALRRRGPKVVDALVRIEPWSEFQATMPHPAFSRLP